MIESMRVVFYLAHNFRLAFAYTYIIENHIKLFCNLA
jgi:hypothetical protein